MSAFGFDSDRAGDLDRALQQLDAERRRNEDLAAALAQAQLQVAGLEQRLRQISEAPSGDAALSAALAEQVELAEQYRVEAADLRSMFDAMEHRIDVLQKRVASARDDSDLREQIAELESQRRGLAEEVENERRLRAAAVADSQPRTGDDAARLTSIQASFDAAVAKHAEEARALREDAELHRALARDRETELSRVTEECSILRQSMESTIVELEGVRAEHTDLSEQLRRFSDGDFDGQRPDSEESVAGLRLVDSDVGGDDVAHDGLTAAEISDIEGAEDEADQRRLLVINLDGDPFTRSSIEEAVAGVSGADYCCEPDGERPPGAEVSLVVNLASDKFDLNWLTDCDRWGLDEPEALAYCGRDGRGVFFRKVMFFPPPCDFDECAARLLSGADTLQRVLAVGEDVDFMSGLRESLGRVRTSTAIAFDGRQAVDLIPMVKPQMVLIDLNLPRGGGLRIASQIAANPDLRNVAIAMFWSQPIDPASFRQHAVYAMRDVRIDPAALSRSVKQILDNTMRGMVRSIPFSGAAMAGLTASSQAGS